jgi:antitoxin (DNA-binding transcriptional repressor) of toxin-antitoxin stability system
MRYVCPEQTFSEYLRPAETGESFIITGGGKPVFELKYI